MDNDILAFTKLASIKSGVELADYVINYIDENTIAYGLLNQLNFNVDVNNENNTTVIKFTVKTNECNDRINSILRFIDANPTINVSGVKYNITSRLLDNDLSISIFY